LKQNFTCLTLKTLTEGVRGNGTVEVVWTYDKGNKSGTETKANTGAS